MKGHDYAETSALRAYEDESQQQQPTSQLPRLPSERQVIANQLNTRQWLTNVKSWLTWPLIATGLSNTPCMPSIADCGGFMIGVPNMEPNTPPLLIVNVPPSMSSIAKVPLRAWGGEKKYVCAIVFRIKEINVLYL